MKKFTYYFKKYKKQARLGLLIALLSVTGFLVAYLSFNLNEHSLGTARLEIVSGGDKRAFEGEVIDGMTVFDALRASALAGNISFNFKS